MKKTILQQHKNWVKQSTIAFTPTFIINGKKLPGRYSLEELPMFLSQLEELLMEPILK